MPRSRIILAVLACAVCSSRGATASGPELTVPETVTAFARANCLECHDGSEGEGGLDLAALAAMTDPAAAFERWVEIVDRVAAGEMPPKDAATLTDSDRRSFVASASHWLTEHERSDWVARGRVRARRLTNRQLERTLHDLLGIDVPLAALMPDEPRPEGFTTVANGQSMSHFQLERHLGVVDAALDEAFRRASTPPDDFDRTFEAQQVSRTNPRRRCREPELIGDRAVTWSSGLEFYGRLPVTTAREDGWYRFTIRASGLNIPDDRGVWCTVRTGRGVSSAPLLEWVGALEAGEKPGIWTYETWLPRGHMLEVRPGDVTLKRARFQGGQVGTGEGGPQKVPGVGIHAIHMRRIHHGPDDDGVRQLLFGELADRGRDIESDDPHGDAARLLATFAERAFRRPVDESDIASYVDFVRERLDTGTPFVQAMRAGYRAILCSPRFLYLTESPGPLDDHAIASRLSYFLWNTMPDAELIALANAGQLRDEAIVAQQVERMLAGDRGRQFVRDFAAEWLDLDQIDFTVPDRRLHPDFDLVVQNAMLDETHAFLGDLLERDADVSELIDSDFTYLNERLARYYRIDGVEGDHLRRVELDPRDHRGGVLTQGAILKVTANGTTTSPVVRGVWVSERLLGVPIPDPPANVPAIEPDVRGATSIREMLEKHREDASCASCHVKIDPPGFALETYDPAGRWRERYGRGGRGGARIDTSATLPDGRSFEDVDDFRDLILAHPENVARCVAEHLLTYGSGGPVSFADRPDVERIVSSTAETGYGFRSLIRAVALSETFRTK